MAFTLPPLPYPADALEAAIDKTTMEIHHGKHHKAYVDNLNAALEGQHNLQSKPIEQLLRDIESGIDKLSQTAGEEIRELDVSIIQLQQKRYRARLGFWLARRTELAAAPNQ